ncbi:MAG TPA: JAB domain-containing protein [Sphingomonas sp.]|nr:JAB domain-containing protein [Sphingomonas sp.]
MAEVLAAPTERLRRATGSEAAARLLRVVSRALRRATVSALEVRPVLSGAADLKAYLNLHLAYERVESVRLLYLDAAGRLIAEERLARGTPDEVPLHPRSVLSRALELEASGIVVAHNHPSGKCAPSAADLAVTQSLASGAEALGIRLVDHLVVTRRGWASVFPAASPAQGRGGSLLADPGVAAFSALDTAQRHADSRDEDLLAAVRLHVLDRRQRDALFPKGTFCDPAWDILLEVFANELNGAKTSVKSACLAAEVPVSTALRWVRRLHREGVLTRTPDPTDRRRTYLALTVSARAAMIECFATEVESVSDARRQADPSARDACVPAPAVTRRASA